MLVLIQHLPRDSALLQAVTGEEAGWSLTDHLLALAVDHLAIGNWLFTAAHTDNPPEQPKPIPRPGAPEQSSSTPEEIHAFFATL